MSDRSHQVQKVAKSVDQAVNRLDRYIGDNIRQARERQGMSLANLEQASGVDEALIRRYEAGLEKVRPAMLCQIAEALDVTVGSLFGMPEP